MNVESDFDFLIKIVLLGDSSVGKTNLVLRYTLNTFSLNTASTIGYDYKAKNIILNKSKKIAKLQIWDTAGQEKYMAISRNVFQRMDGVMLVYDITNFASFKNINRWLNIVKDHNDTLPLILVGNKIDRENERIVRFQEGKKLADEYKMNFLETSALNGENVDEAFIKFANEVFECMKKSSGNNDDNFSISKQDRKKKKCC